MEEFLGVIKPMERQRRREGLKISNILSGLCALTINRLNIGVRKILPTPALSRWRGGIVVRLLETTDESSGSWAVNRSEENTELCVSLEVVSTFQISGGIGQSRVSEIALSNSASLSKITPSAPTT